MHYQGRDESQLVGCCKIGEWPEVMVHAKKAIMVCECGRVNRVMITPEILEPHPGDDMALAAWKGIQRRDLARADRFYREQEHGQLRASVSEDDPK